MRSVFAASFFFCFVCFLCKANVGAGKILKTRSGHAKNNSIGCPLIDNSQIVNTPSDCSGSDGSITGIAVTGTGIIKYAWYNAEQDIISKTADLTGVPPGNYKLEVSDQSKCTPTVGYYTVGQANPVEIDSSQLKVVSSGCSNNGSITGLQVQNGNQYQWQDAYGTNLANTLDLNNIGSGFYTLTATNASGCSTQATFQVPSNILLPQVTHIDTVVGTCNGLAGTLTVSVLVNSPTDVYSYIVLDNYGQQAYNGEIPANGTIAYTGMPQKISFSLGPGAKYSLNITNSNECTVTLGQYSLPATQFKILTNSPFFLVRNDACDRHTGGVFSLKLSGETIPQYVAGVGLMQSYKWTDSLGNVVGQAPDLVNVGKGTYTVVVTDHGGCSASAQFTIQDSTAEAYPPVLSSSNVTLCLPGTVNISVVQPNPKYKYRLYDSTQTAITENDYGIFQINANKTANYTVTTIDHQCESSGTPFKITVIAPGVIIPNTFTPNNDGINDHWAIPHIDDFPGADVAVYNRDGQLVFHSVNYGRPFDGNYNGKQLPGGVYYYTIDLKQPECFGKISGSLTLIR